MSVEYHNGDIFEAPIQVLIQFNSCFCVMGSGLALEVRKRFPEAYDADCETKKGDKSKLGWFTMAEISYCPDISIKYIFNVYSQFSFGRDKRHTNYEYYYNGLENARNKILNLNKDLVVGIPFMGGCGLGGANWIICETMIKEIFKNGPKVLICKKD